LLLQNKLYFATRLTPGFGELLLPTAAKVTKKPQAAPGSLCRHRQAAQCFGELTGSPINLK
jgi:hypothetical protein